MKLRISNVLMADFHAGLMTVSPHLMERTCQHPAVHSHFQSLDQFSFSKISRRASCPFERCEARCFINSKMYHKSNIPWESHRSRRDKGDG